MTDISVKLIDKLFYIKKQILPFKKKSFIHLFLHPYVFPQVDIL